MQKKLRVDQFPLKIGTSLHTSTCSPCTEKKKAHRQRNRQESQRDDPDSDGPSDEEAPTGSGEQNLPAMKDFLAFLGRQQDTLRVEASINIRELLEYKERRKRADALANLMWEVMNYRFLCVFVPLLHLRELTQHGAAITANMITSYLSVLRHATYTTVLKLTNVNMHHQRVKSRA